MTEQALDDLLRQVMLDAARQEYGDLIDEQPEHDFSPAFEKKMKKLIRRAKHPVWHNFVHAAACVLLALLLTSCAVLAVSPEAREVFAGWVREVYDTYFVYRYTGPEEGPAEILSYRPTWIPEGYVLFDEEVNLGYSKTTYYNTEDISLSFQCLTRTESLVMQIELEGGDTEKQVSVSDKPADLYLDEKGSHSILVWTDEEKNLVFMLTGSLTEGELLQIAESVQYLPPRQAPHRPAWLPETYKQSGISGGGKDIELTYQNENSEKIRFCYWEDGWGEQIQEELESAIRGLEPKSVLVNGLLAELYEDMDGTRHLLWNVADPDGTYWIAAPLSNEDLIYMAKSVGAVNYPERLEELRLAWVPGSYRETDRDILGLEDQGYVAYQNQDGNFIMLLYVRQAESTLLGLVNSDRLVTRTVQVNGKPAELYLEEGEANVLVWADSEMGLLLAVHGVCSEEELVKMAESVESVPQEPRPTWIPEGYECFDESSDVDGYIFYQNQENEQIDFLRYHYTDIDSMSIHLSLDPGDVAKQVQLAGRTADLYLGQGDSPSFLVWIDEVNRMTYMLGGTLTEEEFIRIAESVRNEPIRPAPHRPAWVPEGYLLQGESNGGGSISLHYDAVSGERILFRYWREGHDNKLEQELQEAVRGLTSESVRVNELPAQFYAGADGINHLVWAGAEPDELYWLSAPLSSKELIWIAESVGYMNE